MAKKYMSYERLQEYDGLIKQYIDTGVNSVEQSVDKITSGDIVVKEAQHATSADSATTATNATNATTASKLGSSTLGSTTKPIYLNGGTATECSTYAGGTKVTLNGSAKGGADASFYAPTAAGTKGQVLTSNGSGAPTWTTSLPVANGGTGATTEAGARTNLDVYSKSEVDTKVSNSVNGLASTSSVNSAISTHNSSTTAHSDIRQAIAEVKEDVDAFFKDATISTEAKDTLKEIQDYITSDVAAAAAMTASINGKADKATTLSGYGIANAYTKTEIDGKVQTLNGSIDAKVPNTRTINGKALTGNITLTPDDIGAAAAAHNHDAYVNQNAFSNVKVGSTTVAADSATDTLELASGTGISITGDATNDKVTIKNTGVISVATGTEAGTISVNTNGTAANVAVYGFSTLANTVSTNTQTLGTHNTAISNLQTAVGNIQEITSAEIQALFSAN